MQSPGLAALEALGQVMRIPEVEVPDLWALDAQNAEEVPCRHLECLGFPRRHRELDNFGHLSPCPVAECGVKRWQLLLPGPIFKRSAADRFSIETRDDKTAGGRRRLGDAC